MCTAPMARLEKFERYTNQKGGISYRCDFISWAEVERNPKYYQMKYRRVDMIGCGKCIDCRLSKSRDKANQMMLEKKDFKEDECWFLTLTYNDENLRTHKTVNTDTGELQEGVTLVRKDASDFIKRLRRYYEYHYNVKGIRYVIAGEYGSQTHRPHYHAIIYGLPLDQSKLKLYKHNESGQSIWTHEELEKVWGLGFVTVGRVTWETCAYVARYVMKKHYSNTNWWYGACGVMPEFVQSSTKPAIGRNYLLKNKENIYHTDSIPIPNKNGVGNAKPPKSFDNWLKNNDPEEYEELRKERKRKAESNERNMQRLTDLSTTERRKAKAEQMEKRSKALPRKEI